MSWVRRLAPPVATMLLVLLAGCGGDRARDTTSPASTGVADGPSCLSALSGSSGPAGSPGPAGPSGPSPAAASAGRPAGDRAVPDLRLRCFAGGGSARLAEIHGPALINLWASWCGPCRQELPAFERYSKRAGDRVRVVGVITDDRDRGAQQSIIDDLRLTFPMVEDPERKLLGGVGKAALPVTLFVGVDGRIAHVYNAGALDEPTIELFVEQYLGVVI